MGDYIANLGLVVQLVASPACFRARGFESASRDQLFSRDSRPRRGTVTVPRASCLVPRASGPGHSGDAFAPQ